MALLLEDDVEISAAGRSAAAISGPGVVTDATLLAAVSNDPGLQLTLLPEPSGIAMSLAGGALVFALAAGRRRRSGRGRGRGQAEAAGAPRAARPQGQMPRRA